MASDLDTAQVDHLLTTTRSVRKRLDFDRPVPRELVLECITVANQAPAGGNFQKVRWLMVDDPEMKAAIADAYWHGYEPYIQSQKSNLGDVEDDSLFGRMLSSSDYLAHHIADVPLLALPCALGDPSDEPVDKYQGWWGSVCPQVWSYMLAARARGLGTCWTNLHLHYPGDVADALGIPDNITQVALVPTAYYTGDTFRPGSRLPGEKITYWNAWKNKD